MPRVVHFELHAEDPERAIIFYSTVFGWHFTKWNGPQDYWMIATGPHEQPGVDGGMTRRPGPAPVEGQAVNSFVCTVDVPSIDDYLAKITSHGGAVVIPKVPIPSVGWLAYARDTEGNVLGVLQPDAAAQ